ncbi:zf-HC2 domain-containing protein [Leifsonia sp. fls2-241-R2A-40a]|uniref:zf-HC2 domain-containing protein n=1 Tax=Leifsonia sp. fls2-241-R2A-40a TaxID=3040290 RepID=UPI00254D3B73|nr:zf-HC2 domain-containing protein [Leifsonia sp. fls2-241-R2A-40a]
MTTHDEFATWDAAYVLGALSPVERREFEAHLRECERCAEAVGELAGMPGILSRVPREQANALLDDEPPVAEPGEGAATPGPGPELLPSLLHQVRRRRVRSRWLVAGLSAAAAAVVVGIAAFLLPAALQPGTAPAASVVMQQVEPSALTADLRLTSEPWGTRIDSRCRYAHVGAQGGGHEWTYAMVITDRAGAQHQISTWTADEGTVADPVATTSIPLSDIATVDIRSAGDGTVLLRSTFG